MKDALALALVHFIWQGAVLALAGALLMRVMRTPSVRYAIGVATMLAMLLAPVLTTAAITNAGASSFIAVIRTDKAEPAREGSAGFELPAVAVNQDGSTPSNGVVIPSTWILSLWTIGVLVLSLRFAGGWAVARGLTRQMLVPVGDELQALAADMAQRLRVRAAVRVCESASMAVPVMLGWLRPVIILPSAAVTALPLAQLEALLAHELAHIRRHDYLVNLLQTVVETLCFYHPAVWWISREVRRHREQCCDDVVVEVCDRLTYVTALSSVAAMATPQLALSATGGSLRDRVRRLVDPSTMSSSPKGVWIAMLPILLVVALVTPQAWGGQITPSTTATVAASAAPAMEATAVVEAMPEEQVRESSAAQEARRARAQAEIEQTQRAVAALLERTKAEQSVAGDRRAAELEKSRRAVNELLERMKAEQGVNREVNETQLKEIQRAVEARAAVRNEETVRAIERMKQEVAERVGEEATLQRQLRELERQLARQKELVEKGLATRDSAGRFEDQIAQLREALERSRTLETRLEQGRAEREARVAFGDVSEYRRGLGATLDSTAALEPDDRLSITIEGEPDLPAFYTVRSDGSIRFPFLGSIRVQGSTTSQVQAVIRKLLTARGLAPNSAVTVSAQRRK